MEDNDTIELQDIKKIIIKHRMKLFSIIIVCTMVAIAIAFMLPKKYESTVLLRAKSAKDSSISLQAQAAAAVLGIGGAQSNTQTYMELLKSRNVLDPVIEGMELPDKDKIDNKSFAKSYLKTQNVKGTDLIEVTGVGCTPEEAQQISAGVVTSLQQYLTRANQDENSLVRRFLKDRIVIAKKEMEDAEGNLEKFRQQEKIFIPDEQAKASIKKLTEFDQKAAQVQVQNDSNQAKLQGVNEQLYKQNAALAQYNLSDNPSVQQLRSQILDKEMALVELEQRFTAKHPNVILAKREIGELTAKLHEEVTNSIAAGTNTMNPVQGGLLKDKVQTETELMVGQAALAAVQKARGDSEQEISKMSAASLTYIGLERQVKITQEVYAALTKNYEQTRVQETMESMDIQIVDEADMPKKPAFPNKTLIAIIGLVIGMMLSFMYVVVLYSRRPGLTANNADGCKNKCV